MNEILAVANLKETQHRRIDIGIKLAHACLDSKLLYNAETWLHTNKNDIKKLENIQNHFYKRLLGVPTGTPNIAITEELGIMSMEYKVDVKKLLEYHRILQMNNTRLPKTVCVQARQLGARNVLDEGQRIMEKHNMKYDEVKVCDMTRNQWKRTVDCYVRKSMNTDITRKTQK